MRPFGAAGIGNARLTTKREIRVIVRARRAAAAAEAGNRAAAADHGRALAALALGHLEDADTVATYVSLPGEPGTGPMRAALAAAGIQVMLPWLREDRDLDWVMDPGPGSEVPAAPTSRSSAMRPPGRLLGRDAVAAADVVILPALAVDSEGRRLGQGGGSYDRVLARLAAGGRRPLLVACVHDDEVLDATSAPVPQEPHDRRVDAILTPTRWVTVAGFVT